MTDTKWADQAEELISDGMTGPWGYPTREQAARAALNAVAYNIALDLTTGAEVSPGQRGRFAALDAIVKAEEASWA